MYCFGVGSLSRSTPDHAVGEMMDFGKPAGKLFACSQAWKVESAIFATEVLVGMLWISMAVLTSHTWEK